MRLKVRALSVSVFYPLEFRDARPGWLYWSFDARPTRQAAKLQIIGVIGFLEFWRENAYVLKVQQ